mmetsp:Transcript_83711/g.237452  ORF Transcript_83711/g.237452 Transcript_83711/m.237452 type:complete len:145 (-) Transcript_83711:175-609(-)
MAARALLLLCVCTLAGATHLHAAPDDDADADFMSALQVRSKEDPPCPRDMPDTIDTCSLIVTPESESEASVQAVHAVVKEDTKRESGVDITDMNTFHLVAVKFESTREQCCEEFRKLADDPNVKLVEWDAEVVPFEGDGGVGPA